MELFLFGAFEQIRTADLILTKTPDLVLCRTEVGTKCVIDGNLHNFRHGTTLNTVPFINFSAVKNTTIQKLY